VIRGGSGGGTAPRRHGATATLHATKARAITADGDAISDCTDSWGVARAVEARYGGRPSRLRVVRRLGPR